MFGPGGIGAYIKIRNEGDAGGIDHRRPLHRASTMVDIRGLKLRAGWDSQALDYASQDSRAHAPEDPGSIVKPIR